MTLEREPETNSPWEFFVDKKLARRYIACKQCLDTHCYSDQLEAWLLRQRSVPVRLLATFAGLPRSTAELWPFLSRHKKCAHEWLDDRDED